MRSREDRTGCSNRGFRRHECSETVYSLRSHPRSISNGIAQAFASLRTIQGGVDEYPIAGRASVQYCVNEL